MTFALAEDAPWALAATSSPGTSSRCRSRSRRAATVALDQMPPVKLREQDKAYIVTGDELRRDRRQGQRGDRVARRSRAPSWSRSPLIPNFWRAPIDNDDGNGMVRRLGVWRKAGAERNVQSVKAEQVGPQLVRIIAEATLPVGDGTKYRTTYNVYGSGDIVVEASMEPAGAICPSCRASACRWRFPAEYSTMTYLGRGPYENYWDRHTGSAVGLYSGSVEELTARLHAAAGERQPDRRPLADADRRATARACWPWACRC